MQIKRTFLIFVTAAGVVSAQERGGFMRMHPILSALDADQDGTISSKELANAAKVLKKLDKDGDGQLSREETRMNFGPGGGRGPGGPGGAQGGNSDEMVKTLLGFDKNGDGKISKDELPERMQPMFDRGDTNHDGFLTKDEITKVAGARVGQGEGDREVRRGGPGGGPEGMRPDAIFAALDTDNNGTISADEIKVAAASLAKLDKNGDGKLTEDEVRPAMGPGRGGPGRGGPGGNPEEMINHLFEENDANKDGKLSKAEAPERMLEMFERADTNKDGFLTKDELKKAFEAQRRN